MNMMIDLIDTILMGMMLAADSIENAMHTLLYRPAHKRGFRVDSDWINEIMIGTIGGLMFALLIGAGLVI